MTAFITATIPAAHSRSWKSPRPGQRPRLEPRRLREEVKLNLSRLVLLTFTVWENPMARAEVFPVREVTIPLSTVAVVLRQGRRQSDTFTPLRILSYRNLCLSYGVSK